MAYVIDDTCTNCGACDPECPTDAIIEKDDKRVVEAEECIDCGACEAVCPVEAISPA